MIDSIQPCRDCDCHVRLSVMEGLAAPEGYKPLCVSCAWQRLKVWVGHLFGIKPNKQVQPLNSDKEYSEFAASLFSYEFDSAFDLDSDQKGDKECEGQ